MELFVGNLPWSVDDNALKTLFGAHGTCVKAKVMTDRDTGRSRGFAFITMGSEAEATAAINALNGQDCQGRALTVRKAEPRQPGGGRPGGGEGGGFGGGGGGGFGGGGDRRGGGGFGGGDRRGGGDRGGARY